MWITLQSPIIIEMAAMHHLDAVIIDLEHSSLGLRDIEQMIVATQLAGMTALVRPSTIDAHEVGRILDSGAEGIVFPMISTKADAAAAAGSLRYPPTGVRGWGGTHTRQVRWSGPRLTNEFEAFRLYSPAYVAAANASVASLFMIEDQSGVDNLEEILKAGTPDAVIFGWADYLVGVEFNVEKSAKALQRIHHECKERGVGIAINVAPRDAVDYYQGCFYVAGVDSPIVSDALGVRISEVRRAIETSRLAT